MIKFTIILLSSIVSLTASAGLFDYFDFSDKEIKEIPTAASINAELAFRDASEPDFDLPTSPQLHYETIVKDTEYLKSHYEELVLILKSFDSLEHNLRGYEERKVVSDLKNYFKDKYLLNQTDLMEIRNNLNEVINK
jgi:hypothetical protein